MSIYITVRIGMFQAEIHTWLTVSRLSILSVYVYAQHITTPFCVTRWKYNIYIYRKVSINLVPTHTLCIAFIAHGTSIPSCLISSKVWPCRWWAPGWRPPSGGPFSTSQPEGISTEKTSPWWHNWLNSLISWSKSTEFVFILFIAMNMTNES